MESVVLVTGGAIGIGTVSAGEIIRVNNMNDMAGTHFQRGGGGGVVTGGFKNVANVFAEVITENGGEIRTNHPVREILIEQNAAVGVRVRPNGGPETELRAPVIINDVPPRHLGRVLPDRYWPLDFRRRIKNQFPLSGLLGFIGLKSRSRRALAGRGTSASAGFPTPRTSASSAVRRSSPSSRPARPTRPGRPGESAS